MRAFELQHLSYTNIALREKQETKRSLSETDLREKTIGMAVGLLKSNARANRESRCRKVTTTRMKYKKLQGRKMKPNAIIVAAAF